MIISCLFSYLAVGDSAVSPNNTYYGVRRVSGLRKEPVVSVHGTRNERVGVFHEMVGFLFFSGI